MLPIPPILPTRPSLVEFGESKTGCGEYLYYADDDPNTIKLAMEWIAESQGGSWDVPAFIKPYEDTAFMVWASTKILFNIRETLG